MKTKFIFSIVLAVIFSSAKAQMPELPFGFGKNGVDASVVPASYEFTWKYTMAIKTDGREFTADYLLQPNANYFGMNLTQANGVFMIMDNTKKITITTFGGSGKKMAKASKTPDYDAAANAKNLSKFIYKALPEKTILGYKCKGVEATNADYVMTFYYTNDAPVNFRDMFQSSQMAKIPDAFSKYFKPGEKPLILSADIKDVKKGKTTTLNCVSLEKSAYTFKKADYSFM